MRRFGSGHGKGSTVGWVVQRWVWVLLCVLVRWGFVGLWVATAVIWVLAETKILA
jgi:hypothetical protein